MSKIELSEYLAKNGNMTVDEGELNKLLGIEPKRAGMPKVGDDYYSIDTHGIIRKGMWRQRDTDLYRYDTLNCFKTKEEAEKAKEALLMHGKLMRYAEKHNEFELDWEDNSQKKHNLILDDDSLVYDWTFCKEYHQPYFSSEEIMRDAIKSVGGEKEVLRVLYGVE